MAISTPISLGKLATSVGCELIGDPDVQVDHVAGLKGAGTGALSFLASSAYADLLSSTAASAVVLRRADADACPVSSFVSENPYATYARMAALIHPDPQFTAGVHARAVVDESATVAASAHIAANAVVGAGATIGEQTFIGPGCVIGTDCVVGAHSRLIANVTLVQSVVAGDRLLVHPGAVIGADGFGNAMTADGWVKVPQVGGVHIGDDVEIGANTTVDRGAIGDTIIGNGVRIDNLCMIAHNVEVGDHTAMAAMTGIAGSAKIGKRCLFAGKAGTVGHVTVCDDVVVSAKTFISKDVTTPGTYSASFPAEEAKAWARQLARFRRLGRLIERVKKLEQ